MEPTAGDLDELVEFWTLLDEDRELLGGKRGATARATHRPSNAAHAEAENPPCVTRAAAGMAKQRT